MDDATSQQSSALRALGSTDASTRLRAALALGTQPAVHFLEPLVERCAVEPDFHVREMLTWAIIQLPADLTLPPLRRELASPCAQARSQALHTLSKIGSPQAWGWVFPKLLADPDIEVSRAAWRVAVAVVPRGFEQALLATLMNQFGRGGLEAKASLARALVALAAIHEPTLAALEHAQQTATRGPVRAQIQATLVVLRDPGASFAGALEEAERGVR